MNLIELVSLSNAVRLSLIESAGEITDETSKALAVLESNLPKKVDGYHYLVNEMEVEAEKLRAKAAEYTRLANSFENYCESLKARLKLACETMKVKELVGIEYKWKLTNAKSKVIIEDEAKIPQKYKKVEVVTTTKILKDQIYEELKADKPVEGAKLEPSTYMKPYLIGVKK